MGSYSLYQASTIRGLCRPISSSQPCISQWRNLRSRKDKGLTRLTLIMKNPIFRSIKKGGYEVSTKGDKRYSSLYATLEDGSTIETSYRNSNIDHTDKSASHDLYKSLWTEYFCLNPQLLDELLKLAKEHDYCLTDSVTKSIVNHADIIAEIMNDINNVNY